MFAICEVTQPLAAGFDVSATRPRIASWMADVIRETKPHFDAAHVGNVKLYERVGEGVQEAYQAFLEEKAEGISGGS